MSLGDYLVFSAKCLYYSVGFIGIVMLRCTFISLLAASAIMVLRRTVCRHLPAVRCALWSGLLLVPFLGRLKWYYETREGLRFSWWLTALCMKEHFVFNCIYVTGVLCCFYIMIKRHRRLRRMLGGMKDMGRFWVTELTVSPFSMGLFHPRIVIPDILYKKLSETELEIVLQHEECHIKLYHLWMLRAWELLSCIFWMNPLMWLGLRYFKQDLEQVCDSVCMHGGRLEAAAYGEVLLKCISMLSGSENSLRSYAAFAGESDYQVLKTRLLDLQTRRRLSRRRVRGGSLVLCGMLLILLAVVNKYSYPRYTLMEDVAVFDSTGTRYVLEDSAALREAVVIEEDVVHVNRKAFDRLLSETDWQEDTYFIFFGGFFKMPGIGGGGNGVFFDYADTEGDVDIPYDDNEDIWYVIMRYL